MAEFEHFLTNFGGMGVCVGIMAYFIKYCIDRLIPTIDSFKEALDRNTEIIQRLDSKLELFDRGDKHGSETDEN